MLIPYRRTIHQFELNGKATTLKQELPKDIEAAKEFGFVVNGYIAASFASGTPVAKIGSGADTLIEAIQILRGNDAIKSISPALIRYENLLLQSQSPEFRSSAAASGTFNPTTDADRLAHGTTTQNISMREVLRVHMGYPYAKTRDEMYRTCLRTARGGSHYVAIKQKPYSNILDEGNTCVVTYSGDELNVDVNVLEFIGDEAAALPCDHDYRQEEKPASPQPTGSGQTGQVDIELGGALSSIMMMTFDGASGSATTGTANQPNDLVVKEVELDMSIRGGRVQLVNSTFLELKDEVKAHHQYYAPKSGGRAVDDGFSAILFHKDGFNELVDISEEAAVSLKLKYKTTASVSYTNAAEIRFLVNRVMAIKK
jgi:hypothetical protein